MTMRILLSTDAIGGVWDFSLLLAGALHARGHSILLASIGEPTAEQRGQVPAGIALESRSAPLEWMRPPVRELERTALWLRERAAGWGADLMHLNQMVYPGLVDLAVPCLVTVHSDVLSWLAEVEGSDGGGEWDEYRQQVRDGLEAADGVVAPSAYQAGLTRVHLGCRIDAVIHNGVPAPGPGRRVAKEPIVISAGRAWDAAKGSRILDEALRRLGPSAPRSHLLGSIIGPDGSRFQSKVLRCEGRLERDRAQEWLARAQIYVAPSLYEPFGLAPLEAALHGCALILSDIGSFRELWDGCASFVEPGNAGELADALGGLVHDPERIRSLASAAESRAREYFSLERCAEGYLEVYGAVLDGSRPVHQAHRSEPMHILS